MTNTPERPAWVGAATERGVTLPPEDYLDFPRLRLEGEDEFLPTDAHRGFIACAKNSYDREESPAPFDALGPLDRLDMESMDDLVCALVTKWMHAYEGKHLTWVEAFCRTFPSARAANTIRGLLRSIKSRSWGQYDLLDQLALMGVAEGFYELRLLEQNGTGQDLARNGRRNAEFARTFHGLTDEEFQDLCMPSLGLNEDGVRAFDYGSRVIEMRVRDALEFEYVDTSTNKSYKNLPRAKKTDDADKVKALSEALKPSLKIARENAKRLWPRLQRDMASGRAWRVSHVTSRLMPNPVVMSTLRGLIWHLGERDGVPVLARLDEESAFVDLELEQVSLEGLETIRIARISDFGDRLNDWVRHMEDFEVVQPIEQLADAVFVANGPVVAEMMREFEAGTFILDIKAIQRLGKEGGATLDPQKGSGMETFGVIGVRGTSPDHELVAVTSQFQGAITGWSSAPIVVHRIGYRAYVEDWYKREDPGDPLTLEDLSKRPGDDVIAFFKAIASLRLAP